MSGYWCYVNKFPNEKDPIQEFTDKINKIYGLKDGDENQTKAIKMDVLYPYFLWVLKY